jgi:hypothetical protein
MDDLGALPPAHEQDTALSSVECYERQQEAIKE